jgi:excinuclease ABC subunit B
MYADRITDSMKQAISETSRRREKQLAYNRENHITPETIKKAVRDLIIAEKAAEAKVEYEIEKKPNLSQAEIKARITGLEEEMLKAAADLAFERAAELRDEIRGWEKLVKD